MDPKQLAPLNTYQGLVTAFTEFLTVAIHLILYEREIYPRESFLRARKYDCPVQQNRHPKVCKWITDAVAAVGEEMLKCTVRQTSIVLYSPDSLLLERYVFSTDLFPIVERGDALVSFDLGNSDLRQSSPSNDSRQTTPTPQAPDSSRPKPSAIELTAQFAAVLLRISTQAEKLGRLPEGCSFTVAIELREPPAGRVPLDNQITWVPVEPGLQPPLGDEKGKKRERTGNISGSEEKRQKRGDHLECLHTLAVRTVEAGPFVMEVWIEEGGDKVPTASMRPQRQENQSPKVDAHLKDANE